MSVRHMRAGLARFDVDLGLALGPAGSHFAENFPFPVMSVEKPDDIRELKTAIHDLGGKL